MQYSYAMRNILSHCLLISCVLLQTLPASAQESKSIVGINSELTYKMLEPNQNVRKVNILINERHAGRLETKKLIIGTSLIAIADFQHSNTDSRFAYLMRHPTSTNQIGTEVSEAVIHSFQFSVYGAINPWIATFAEMLYNPEQSFGTGTITAIGRNQIQLYRGFVVLGNLDKFPIYGAIGKMDAPFGLMNSVSPFTNSTMWHAFSGLGYGAQIGFKKYNIEATFMAVQGGSQFRAMNTIVGDSTNVPSQLNNFTADLNYTLHFASEVELKIGASYLRGSVYNQDFPVIHFKAGVMNNPASTVYSEFLLHQRLLIIAAFAKTAYAWPGTYNPSPPLNIYPASKVSSLVAGAKYTFNPESKIAYTISAEFSNYIAGPDGSPWERQNQYILGFCGLINKSSKFFIEVFGTQGYVPLNFISGSNPNDPFPEGTTHCSNSATSLGVVVGAQIVF